MTEPGLTPGEDRVLRAHIDALPASVDPARDLWPEIKARVDAVRVRPMMPPLERPPATVVVPASRPWWPGLAAAAALLVVASVSLTWLVMRPDATSSTVAEQPLDSAPPVVPAAALASFASYERSAADLASALEQRAERLDPATRAVLERSLRTIDEALTEARAALAADPSSAAFHSFVEAAYRQKLDFLRRANDVAALQGA
jgi:hypothetical protein